MSMDGFLGLISSYGPREIRKDIQDLLAYQNKDKDNLCKALTLIYKNIDDWYKELNGIYSHEIWAQLEGKQVSEEVRKKIVELTNRAERADAAASAIDYLERIKEDKKNKRLGRSGISGRFRQQKWARQLDIKQVKSLQNALDRFIEEAIGEKKKELDKRLNDTTYYTPADRINTWLRDLSGIKRRLIRPPTEKLMHKIGCGKQLVYTLNKNVTSSNEST
jgi:hypothetical protein